MDYGGKKNGYSTIPVPEKVGSAQLQQHFKETYKLDEVEAKTLVVSSSKSLIEFLEIAESVLEKKCQGVSPEKIQELAHRGKGLFLIMGQEEWALYINALNRSDPDKIYDSIQTVVNHVRESFSDIIMMG